jgi:hypothetical protein
MSFGRIIEHLLRYVHASFIVYLYAFVCLVCVSQLAARSVEQVQKRLNHIDAIKGLFIYTFIYLFIYLFL